MVGKRFSSAWDNVDRAGDTGARVAYLDAVGTLEAAQAYKRQTYDLLAPREGNRLLDVGCGPGDDALALATLVGPSGQVVGVDISTAMIAVARQRSERSRGTVDFAIGDAHALPFADASFDGCRADRTLQHLNDPARALEELVRVARPGGTVVVADLDWETLAVDGPEPEVARRVAEARCQAARHGRIGRQLPRLFRRAGLAEVGVVPATVVLGDYVLAERVLGLGDGLARAQASGAVSATAAMHWVSGLREADQVGEFFCAMTGFIVAGRKP